MPRFFLSCAKGLEPLLADEIKSLSGKPLKTTDAGISAEGDWGFAYRASIWSRIASRIYFPIQEFSVENTDSLYEECKKIPWLDHMSEKETFAIDASLRASKISHSQYAALRMKDAIVDYFREKNLPRPSVDRENPDIRWNIHVRGSLATVSLDLTGKSMHERGYRVRAGIAPIKENLAAALLVRAGWPDIAKNQGSFLDLLCGSGTFPIEAACIAFDIAPGILRRYSGLTNWKNFNSLLWKNVWTDALDRKKKGLEKKIAIAGFDRDESLVSIAKKNASIAGLETKIQFSSQSVGDLSRRAKDYFSKNFSTGLILSNPPYGERLGDSAKIGVLYAELGKIFRDRFSGWKAGVFTGNPSLGKMMGLRSHKQYSFFNGTIPCELLLFSIGEGVEISEKAEKTIALRENIQVKLSHGGNEFRNRLEKNRKHLAKWSKREGVECYRVYDADLPDYNVAVDIYKDSLVIQEYSAPEEIPEEKARRRLEEVLLVAPQVLNIEREKVFLKERSKQKGKDQYTRRNVDEEWKVVEEGGHKFYVNLSNYLDTGLFLDHRITRKMIENEVKDKHFLNLFAYTGSATIYAIAGGAASTTTVDLSNTYLDWAERNIRLNGFRLDKNYLIQADCRLWLKNCKTKFDYIFIDPPTFSNSKKMRDPFQVQSDYLFLLEHCRRILSDNGKILFSNNFRKFKLDAAKIEKMGLTVRDISRLTIPADFLRHRKIHQCWELKARTIEVKITHNPKKSG